jgi:hypothetical protein
MSDTEPRKRVSGWKVFGIIAGALAVFGVVALFALKVVTDRRCADLQEQLTAEIAAVRSRPAARPVLFGEAQPGNAWDDYDKALAQFELVGGTFGIILDDKHEDKPEGALSKLPLVAAPIAQLRRGAHRSEAKKDYDWEQGGLMTTALPLSSSVQLSSLALLDARVLAKQGKSVEAVEEILDVLQFGTDLAVDGPLVSHMVGMGTALEALKEARTLVAEGKLNPAARVTLEQGLRLLAARPPSFEDAMLRESIFSEATLLNEVSHNFASAVLYLGAVQRVRDWNQRAAAAGRVSWAESQNVDAQIQAEAAKSWNPVTKMLASASAQTGGRLTRQWQAHISLLLVGVHFQSTGEVLDLDDPFGAKLKSAVSGNKLKVWSVGPNGVDDAGSGGWKAHEGKDIVLEVPRK